MLGGSIGMKERRAARAVRIHCVHGGFVGFGIGAVDAGARLLRGVSASICHDPSPYGEIEKLARSTGRSKETA